MLKLIMLEAISNVIHHSHAKDLVIKAIHDSQAAALIVAYRIMDAALIGASNSAGGLNNMRKRATRISTGAKVSIQSTPGVGTTVEIELAFRPLQMG